ncbi:DUF177 domain-containing protein [Tissierella sp. MSJ-40]|uniref:DUF177 domain-containing protein n=1 Tax=Tissierella simiarum TaxID=2841534 RepID=A0ABS6E4I8_9FIRM|nr:DUF177 domain-containing protein [Tissierella simiarum]MBU5437741.1 DUF177 domain-containing protein [Tissierella simiarum]
MIIDLSSFLDETINHIHFEEELEENSIDFGGRKIIFTEPIKCEGNIYKVDGDKLINGDIFFKYEEPCDRCLKPFIQEVKTVLSGKLIEGSGNVYDDDDFEQIIYYNNDTLDLRDAIMSQIVVSLPMKSLCSLECKGLCPRCGVDLNNNKCNCVLENVDPRLEKLKDFFPKK